MKFIDVLLFFIFIFGGMFCGFHLVSNVDWFKYFAGCILGGIVGWVFWVIIQTSVEKK